jgi:hypothetical protein
MSRNEARRANVGRPLRRRGHLETQRTRSRSIAPRGRRRMRSAQRTVQPTSARSSRADDSSGPHEPIGHAWRSNRWRRRGWATGEKNHAPVGRSTSVPTPVHPRRNWVCWGQIIMGAKRRTRWREGRRPLVNLDVAPLARGARCTRATRTTRRARPDCGEAAAASRATSGQRCSSTAVAGLPLGWTTAAAARVILRRAQKEGNQIRG